MNHLVIDIEMCKVPRSYRNDSYRRCSEIIQIGAVLLDENYDRIAELSQYVHPVHGVIERTIEKLTGIHNHDVKHAPVLEEALIHLIDWIGNREYKVYAWSDTDFKQLRYEIDSKKIESETVEQFMKPERWIDYQNVFDLRYEFQNAMGLENALYLTDIAIEGRLHDGLADAKNTAKLIKKLEHNPEYKLKNYDEYISKEEEPLNFSLSSVFAGLELRLA